MTGAEGTGVDRCAVQIGQVACVIRPLVADGHTVRLVATPVSAVVSSTSSSRASTTVCRYAGRREGFHVVLHQSSPDRGPPLCFRPVVRGARRAPSNIA